MSVREPAVPSGPMGEYLPTSVGPVHVFDFGGDGAPILLVHGLGGSYTNWLAVAGRMARHGSVRGLDLPGFGLSPPGPDYRLETHRTAVESVIEHTGGPVTLIGNSTGGLLSEMVAAHRPDLVSRLVLVSPATPPVYPDPRLHRPTAWRLAVQATPGLGLAWGRRFLRDHTPEELVTLSINGITYGAGRVPMEVVEASVELARIRKALPWTAEATAKTATAIARMYTTRSAYIRMIRSITAPTLAIQGIHDHIVSPTAVEWLCRLRPDWELAQMTDTGHTPQMDAPVRFMDVLEPWLERTPAGSRAPGKMAPTPN